MENRMSKSLSSSGRLVALCLLISLAVTSSSYARPMNGQAQNPRPARAFPPTQYVPSHDFDIKHIALNLRFDWAQEQLIGTETITLTPLVKDLVRVELDAADMTFTSVNLAAGTVLKYEADASKQKLWVALDHPHQPADE